MVSDILVDWERMQMTLSLYSLGYETLINDIKQIININSNKCPWNISCQFFTETSETTLVSG